MLDVFYIKVYCLIGWCVTLTLYFLRRRIMAKLEQMNVALEKLYAKRKDLDKQIVDAEKKLLTEVKNAAKAAAKAPAKRAARKPAAKKAAVKRPVKKAVKKPARKPAVKKPAPIPAPLG